MSCALEGTSTQDGPARLTEKHHLSCSSDSTGEGATGALQESRAITSCTRVSTGVAFPSCRASNGDGRVNCRCGNLQPSALRESVRSSWEVAHTQGSLIFGATSSLVGIQYGCVIMCLLTGYPFRTPQPEWCM